MFGYDFLFIDQEMKNTVFKIFLLFVPLIFLSSCTKHSDWPESPLYDFIQEGSQSVTNMDIEEAREAIVGHYAHYDVVAYEDKTTKTPMLTFIISYGFTEYYLEDGKLMQADRFVHAEQKLNNLKASSSLSDKAVQAIKPRVQEVELSLKDGRWFLYRSPSPSLLGISGDPTQSLSTDPDDPNFTDPDKDGNPGVTVKISVGKYFNGEIYIARREIFSNYLTLNRNGTLSGYIVDESEQFVIAASKKILRQPSNSIQHRDMGLSPILLVPIDPEIDTPEELMQIRDEIFPQEPEFHSVQ